MRTIKVAFLVSLAFLLCGSVAATTLPEFTGTNFSGSSVSLVGWDPFNHNLGTLDSVGITIDGAITVAVQTQVMFDGLQFLPAPYSVSISQNFTGEPSHAFFSFVLPATFSANGVGTGQGEVQTLTFPFIYTFRFDSFTDLLGGQTAVNASGPTVPPGLAYGTLAGFTDTFFPFMQELIMASDLATVGASITSISSDGGIIVEYDYTPAPAPAPVPEPASLLLLGSGLCAVAVSMRKKLLG